MHGDDLKKVAQELRKDIVKMIGNAGSGHPGGSLSACDLATVLYFDKANVSAENWDSLDRDHIVFSKGHAAPLLYAILARKGFFDKSELMNLRKVGSGLQGHPCRVSLPGVETSTGPLGQGISVAVGMALASKIDKRGNRVYFFLGDGEVQEGQVWEAAMFAAHYKLNNICGVLDFNNMQIDGKCSDVMGIEPIADKWRAFGWHVVEIDGHDLDAIKKAYDVSSDKPVMIIAKTVKGKGVSYMENQVGWHGKAPNADEVSIAVKELGGDSDE